MNHDNRKTIFYLTDTKGSTNGPVPLLSFWFWFLGTAKETHFGELSNIVTSQAGFFGNLNQLGLLSARL